LPQADEGALVEQIAEIRMQVADVEEDVDELYLAGGGGAEFGIPGVKPSHFPYVVAGYLEAKREVIADTVSERTSGGGVAIDGVTLQDTTVDVNGTADAVILDADGDTTLSAPTDDQMDMEIGGADIVVMNDWGATTITTDTTEHLLEIQDSTPVMTGGTNSLSALNIDMGVGNSTGGTNSIYGVLVDGISADTENIETAISIGSGWDRALNATGDIFVDGWQDEVQMTVQGHGTQTNDVLVVESSDGTDQFTVDSSGNGSFSGASGVGTWLDLGAQTTITVVNGSAFTATGSYQPIQAVANVTPTITMQDAGDMLIVTNVSTYTITIVDSGTTMLNTDRALGQYDTLMLLCDGTNWLELSYTDN
jgi:hypothetical protein